MKKIIFLSLFFQSCVYHKMEVKPVCIAESSKEITNQANIKLIIENNCLSCHSNKIHDGGVKLEDLQDLKFYANSILYDQIIGLEGNPPKMPKGYKLTDCEVLTIKKWIESGMH